MDVRMPDLDGISATREVLAARPTCKVVILTTFEQDDYIFGALSAGASGFLLKRTSPEELIAGDPRRRRRRLAALAVRHAPRHRPHGAAAGGPTRRPTSASTSSRRASARCWPRSPAASPTREIARVLVIEESTVKTHVKRILMKLRLRDRVQAVIFAYESGLVRPGSGGVTSGPRGGARCSPSRAPSRGRGPSGSGELAVHELRAVAR